MLATGEKDHLREKNPQVCAGLVVKHTSMLLYFCVFRTAVMNAVSIQKLLTRWHQPLLLHTAPTTAGAGFQTTVQPSGNLIRSSDRVKLSLSEV